MTNDKEKTKPDKPFYHGHRQRLRDRYFENGIDSLHEHEILEMLLGYTILRADTKPLAHRLIDSFGSLESVFSASRESLKKAGLSDTTIAHIKLVTDTNKWIDRNKMVGKKCADHNETGLFMVNELDGCGTETLVALLLDSKDCVLGFKKVCEGSFRSTSVNMKNLIEACFERNAAKVILAHNHPSGDIRPSTEDHVTTTSIEGFLTGVGIELVEHYIIANGTYFGIKRNAEDARRSYEMQYKRNFGFYDET